MCLVIQLNSIHNIRRSYNCRSNAKINLAVVERLNWSVVVNQRIAVVISQLTELCQLKRKLKSAV